MTCILPWKICKGMLKNTPYEIVIGFWGISSRSILFVYSSFRVQKHSTCMNFKTDTLKIKGFTSEEAGAIAKPTSVFRNKNYTLSGGPYYAQVENGYFAAQSGYYLNTAYVD